MSTQSPKRRRPPISESDPPQPPRKSTRKRAALACEECRVRKRRCDGATPVCGGCMKRMSTCVYASEVEAKQWRNNVIQSLRTQLEELEKEDRTSETVPEINNNVHTMETHTRTTSVPLMEEGGNVTTASIGQPRSVASHPRTPLTDNQNDPAKDHMAAIAPPSPFHRSNTLPNGPSPGGGLEPCSVELLMEPIDQAIGNHSRQETTTAVDQAYSGPGQKSPSACFCDQILDTTWCSLPLRRHADRMLDLYFSRVHLVYPILHQWTFRKQYERLWHFAGGEQGNQSRSCSLLCRQKSQGKTFPAMLNAVFALASLFEPGIPKQKMEHADSFFSQTQKIDLLEILDDEVGIELIQLGLLMGFYLQSTERFSKCWNITGLTIRMAQNIGLQLSLAEARTKGLLTASVTQVEWEMRVRVWYGCVLLDREISMSFGRPLMIVDGSDSLRLPDSIDDSYLSDETGKWDTQPTDLPSLLESYIQSIKLYDILGQVLHREERRFSKPAVSRPEGPIETGLDVGLLLSLDSKIMAWRDALPSYLRYDPCADSAQDEAGVTPETGSRKADLSSQAKRLYTRFLHVRVLILRPALDLLFQTQRIERPTKNTRSRETPVRDLMLTDVAAQCVYSADTLVKFLDAEIRSHSLVAWWYNISYLHTCGSTLLMSRLCTFSSPDVLEGIPTSWAVCLRCISSYTNLSSIARKSFHLLQDSAKRLHLKDSYGNENPHSTTENPRQEPLTQGPYVVEDSLQPSTSLDRIPDPYWHPQASKTQMDRQALYEMPNVEPTGAPSDLFDNDLWGNEIDINSYWSFTPYLSQLETLPPIFDPSHMEGSSLG